jgi:hypothetical protein
MNGLADAIIGPTTAKIARHRLGNLVVRRLRILCQHGGSVHDLTALAVAALRDIFGDPGLLQRMKPVCGESLDRGDVLSHNLRNWRRAGTNRGPVDVHGAGAAKPGAAAEFCAGKFEGVAKHPQQWGSGRDRSLAITAIYAQSNVGHKDFEKSGMGRHRTEATGAVASRVFRPGCALQYKRLV